MNDLADAVFVVGSLCALYALYLLIKNIREDHASHVYML